MEWQERRVKDQRIPIKDEAWGGTWVGRVWQGRDPEGVKGNRYQQTVAEDGMEAEVDHEGETWVNVPEWPLPEPPKIVLQVPCFHWSRDAMVQRRH